jgi:hypothetical protein
MANFTFHLGFLLLHHYKQGMWRVWRREGANWVSVGGAEGKKTLGKPCVNWRIILKCIFSKGDEEDMDWIDLVQDKQKWRALLNAAMNLWVQKMQQISLLSQDLLSSHRKLSVT